MTTVSWARMPTGGCDKAKYITQFNRRETNGEELCKIMAVCLWTPIVWVNNSRSTGSVFEFSDFCALDFENPEVSIKQIQRLFCDTWHILGTTRNHQKQKDKIPPCDRFRLILKWERRITCADEYKHNMKWLAGEYGSDKSACDAARPFFPSAFHSAMFDDDLYLQPVRLYVPPSEADRARFEINQKHRYHHGVLSGLTRRVLTQEILEGTRNHDFFIAACELTRAGLSLEEIDERLLSSPTFEGKPLTLDLIKTIKDTKRSIVSAYKNERARRK